jgi:hypothetical protein
MKSSLKIATMVLAFAGLSFAAKAQTTTTTSTSTTTKSGIRYSIGVDAGIPVGDFKDSHKWNLGGSVQADIPVANQLFVTVNAGYNNIFGKKDVGGVSGFDVPNIQLLPVKAGLKYFVIPNFYVQGEAGAAFLLNKNECWDTINQPHLFTLHKLVFSSRLAQTVTLLMPVSVTKLLPNTQRC